MHALTGGPGWAAAAAKLLPSLELTKFYSGVSGLGRAELCLDGSAASTAAPLRLLALALHGPAPQKKRNGRLPASHTPRTPRSRTTLASS